MIITVFGLGVVPEYTALFISVYLITCMSKPSCEILQCHPLNRLGNRFLERFKGTSGPLSKPGFDR
jgi:hypothetical protein